MDTVKEKKSQIANPTTPFRKRNFAQFIVDEGHITKKDLADINLRQSKDKMSLESAILSLELMDEETLTRAKADFFRLPYVDLRNQKIGKDVLKLMTKEILQNYKFIPFKKDGEVLKIALTNPADLQTLEALEFLAQRNNYEVELYLTSESSYKAALSKSQTISSEVGEALSSIEIKKGQSLKPEDQKKAEVKERKIEPEAPIAKIVDVIIKHAIEARASDIHIEPQEHDLRIRYRVDGILRSSLVVPKVVHPAIVSRIKILSNLKIDEQRLPQDGRFNIKADGHSIDFRVSTLPTVNGEKVVMRILDKSGGVPTLEELGIRGIKLDWIKESITKSHGMILVTGPTGSGKSTTLYSVLHILNKIGVNIVTLEDPVEYYIDGVNQSQINPDIGLTFASGLRSILRQDPNIIMVGEIRDKETAELAVHSALTGHLVLSTLHTNDAIGAIPRLVDMGIEPFLLTASLDMVIAQRLVRKIDQKQKKEIPVATNVEEMIKTQLADIPKEEAEGIDLNNIKIFEPESKAVTGPEAGYKGRVGIFEVLRISDEIKQLILHREPASKILESAKKDGMIRLMQDGLIKVLKGETTMEEVLRVTKS